MESKEFSEKTFSPQKNKSIFKSMEPNLILSVCFHPFYYPVKIMGLFPIQIEKDGSSRFSLCSIQMFHGICCALFFIGESIIFLPFVIRVMETANSSPMEYAADFAFSAANYFAVCTMILLIPYMSPKLSKFWNRVNIIIIFLGENGMGHHFQVVRTVARFYVAIWISFFAVYSALNWWYFDQHLSRYFGETVSAFYVMSIVGQAVLTWLISAHVLYSMVFILFCHILTKSFIALGKLAKTNCTTFHEGKNEKLENIITLYEDLNLLVFHLGATYGIYVTIEVLAMLIATSTNGYFIFSGIRSGPTNICSIAVCIVWLFMFCNTGEGLWQSALYCQRSLKKAALFCHISGSIVAARLGQEPPTITACNYFSINRVLLTKIIGTITTYLVVLLQFHFKTFN